jgi:hypothetical protein
MIDPNQPVFAITLDDNWRRTAVAGVRAPANTAGGQAERRKKTQMEGCSR